MARRPDRPQAPSRGKRTLASPRVTCTPSVTNRTKITSVDVAPAGTPRGTGRLSVLVRHPLISVTGAALGGQLASAATGPVLVRTIGVTARGELALAYVVVLLFSQIAMLGIPSAVAYYIARDHLSARALFARFGREYAWLSILASFAGAGLLWTAVRQGFRLPSPTVTIPLISVGVIIFMWWFILSTALLGELRFNQFALVRFIVPVVYLACVVILLTVQSGASVPLLLAISLAAAGVGAVLSYRFLSSRPVAVIGEIAPVGASLPTRRMMLKFGLRSVIDTAAPIDGLSIDQLVVGTVLTSHDLGLYVIGYAFESLPVLVLTGIATVAGPKLAATNGRSVQFHQMWKWCAVGVSSGITTCVIVELCLQPILSFTFGAGTAGAIPIARILIVAGFFLGMRRIGSAFLQSLGLPGRSAMAEVLGLAALAATLIPLTLRFGAEGAALALLISAACCMLCQIGILASTLAASR